MEKLHVIQLVKVSILGIFFFLVYWTKLPKSSYKHKYVDLKQHLLLVV